MFKVGESLVVHAEKDTRVVVQRVREDGTYDVQLPDGRIIPSVNEELLWYL